MIKSKDVEFYEEHGWWVSDHVIDDDRLALLENGISRYAAGERDWQLPISDSFLNKEVRGVVQSDYLSLQLEEVQAFVHSAPIAIMASRLARTNSIRLFHDQLIMKYPYVKDRPSVIGWHTDKAYWKTCSSSRMLSAWVPLRDVDESNGAMVVWDGSHEWPFLFDMHTFDEQDLNKIEDSFKNCGYFPNRIVLRMRRGQVSFHHCKLVHGSFNNLSEKCRYGYAIHLQDADNRYEYSGDGGHINDLLCRRTVDGQPDYADPEIFPTLFKS